MTSNDNDPIDATTEPPSTTDTPAAIRRPLGRVVVARLRAHGRMTSVLALIAIAAVVGAAYVAGGPPTAGAPDRFSLAAVTVDGQAAATAAPAAPAALAPGNDTNGSLKGLGTSSTDQSSAAGVPDSQSQLLASVESTQIVKTGQMTLEVTDLDAATNQAQATIAGLGGYVDSSNRVGTDADAVASITFRLPVGKWDQALADLHKIGSKVLSEQTSANDVTSQVIDLNARIDNLQKTEAALQAIMARATVIADVIAVETQLSDTQGQIEELTAERDHLKDQAAMSTLTVTFQLPTSTVTTQATQDWTLASQIDQAGAALVRIGQGLATIGVWILIVVLPLGLGLLVLLGIVTLIRRIFGRARRRNAASAA